MKTKVYVSDDKKKLVGSIIGIKKIERQQGGFLLAFSNYDSAYRAAKVFMNSGFETVRIIGKETL